MERLPEQKRDMRLIAICALGTIVTWRFSDYLGPTEFSGGSVTGPMWRLQELASGLFPLAAITAFFYPPIAAGIALLAGVIAWPIYLLFLFPRPIRALFRGEWSTHATETFHLDPWSLAGIATIAALVFISIRVFRQAR
jgi:hypothetical protein